MMGTGAEELLVFHSPFAVPAHNDRRTGSTAGSRMEMLYACEGCRHLRNADSGTPYCKAWNAILSPDCSYWRGCAMRSRR